MHTTCSDGERTPTELIDLAVVNDVTHLSITDHDTIAAYSGLRAYAEEKGITLIPGIEMSTLATNGELHILGYGLELTHPKLMQYSEKHTIGRKKWSKQVVHKLNSLQYDIAWENCNKRAEGHCIARKHIAEELVANDYFQSSEEAFQSLLSFQKPAYVKRPLLTTKEAIALIHECGGKAFIAHPSVYTFHWSLKDLIAEGIDGIEVYYAKHTAHQVKIWKQIAEQLQLLMSTGSDFHGETSRNPQMIGSTPYDAKAVLHWLPKQFSFV